MSTKVTHDTPVEEAGGNRLKIVQRQGCADHDRDLIHDLSRRLRMLAHYDQFIANAHARPDIEACWRDFKKQELENIGRLKSLMKVEIEQQCF